MTVLRPEQDNRVQALAAAGGRTAQEIVQDAVDHYFDMIDGERDQSTWRALALESLGLSARAERSLLLGGIRTVGDLADHCEDDLLDIRGVGTSVIGEIKSVLAQIGLTLTPHSVVMRREEAERKKPGPQKKGPYGDCRAGLKGPKVQESRQHRIGDRVTAVLVAALTDDPEYTDLRYSLHHDDRMLLCELIFGAFNQIVPAVFGDRPELATVIRYVGDLCITDPNLDAGITERVILAVHEESLTPITSTERCEFYLAGLRIYLLRAMAAAALPDPRQVRKFVEWARADAESLDALTDPTRGPGGHCDA